jgi:acetyl/propionyl-CoA carboxylase alpha subunit
MELRVYAEDPMNNFLPDIGRLEEYKKPEGAGIRIDDGFREGMDIPIFYDPMIAKLITYGKNREEAIDRMKRAINEFKIKGVKTTLPFGTFVMNHPNFISGDFDTHFVEKHYKPELLESKLTFKEVEILQEFGAVHSFFESSNTTITSQNVQPKASNWKKNRGN